MRLSQIAGLLSIVLFSTIHSFAQEVTTLANVTANGGVTLDADGNIYVAHFGPLPITPGQEGTNIYKITPTGDVTLFVDGQLTVGSGNHFDSQGFLYQSNFQINKVFKIDSDGTVVDDDFATISGPVGITVIENDTLVVCSCNTNSLIKIAQDGSQSTFASGPPFNCANGITQDENGNFYTTNFSDGKITKVTPGGTMTTLGETPQGNGHIAFRSQENAFYIASYSGNRIYRMDMDGTVTPFAGTGSPGAIDSINPMEATFTKPNGIEIRADGCSLYVSQDNDAFREIKFNDLGCLTGIEDLYNELNFRVYPNPSEGLIQILDNQYSIQSIEISQLDGRTVLRPTLSDNGTIDLQSLASGVYSITIDTDHGRGSQLLHIK
jgi:sugar lactone lactonase YvrE